MSDVMLAEGAMAHASTSTNDPSNGLPATCSEVDAVSGVPTTSAQIARALGLRYSRPPYGPRCSLLVVR